VVTHADTFSAQYDAFSAQYDAEQAVRREARLTVRTRVEHADFLLAHRWVIGGPGKESILDRAARIVVGAGFVPSRWTYINPEQLGEAALFQCAGCSIVVKAWTYICAAGCTDLLIRYGHDPLGATSG